MPVGIARVRYIIFVPSFFHFNMKLALSYFLFVTFMRVSKFIFWPYSLEYLLKLVFYSHKLLQTTFKAQMLLSETSFMEKEYRSLYYNSKPPLLSEIRFQSRLEKRAIAFESYWQLDRRRKTIASLKDRVNAIESQGSFFSDKIKQNRPAVQALVYEGKLIENALEEQFSIYAEKCKTNSNLIELEIRFMVWLKQTNHQIRESLNTAVEKYARYTNGGQKRNILGVNLFIYYSLVYISKLFYYDMKLLINAIKLQTVASYLHFLKKEKNSVVAEEAKFISEDLAYQSARKKLLEKYDRQGAAKLQREYDGQRFSRLEREFSIKKKLSVLEEKLINNTKKGYSLGVEMNVCETALDDLIYIFEDRFIKTTFEKRTVEWLNQTQLKIRESMYNAMDGEAWAMDGEAWDKK
uniref:Uncharacterized protein n=1 Tax=Cyphia belfastica TaxID=2041114 RepID=A0A291F2X1_9ASTR|nr:hypothetical protein Cyp_bel1Pt0224 [Cyphia belfastica]ATG26498.1 hypothetical protein Cyp_bel1Pt0224 [Cyphia belfastica]